MSSLTFTEFPLGGIKQQGSLLKFYLHSFKAQMINKKKETGSYCKCSLDGFSSQTQTHSGNTKTLKEFCRCSGALVPGESQGLLPWDKEDQETLEDAQRNAERVTERKDTPQCGSWE